MPPPPPASIPIVPSSAPAAAVIAAIAYLWLKVGSAHGCHLDYLFAPVFTAAAVVILSFKGIRLVKVPLAFVGGKSTGIWLIHSFWCYALTPKLIYAPRYSLFIFLWLLAISLGCAVLLDLAWKYAGKGARYLLKKAEKKQDVTQIS